mmetsp:Transcript_15397/g.35271  ORF Transcript_15397/g.35271 Transcript_15397/m.35271 type:complete len:85 (+) Transcript_15397:263-517(+)
MRRAVDRIQLTIDQQRVINRSQEVNRFNRLYQVDRIQSKHRSSRSRSMDQSDDQSNGQYLREAADRSCGSKDQRTKRINPTSCG